MKIRYNSENMKEQNEKLQSQIDFLNKENHRLNELNDFHNHRCREEEVRKLDAQINELNKENDRLKKMFLLLLHVILIKKVMKVQKKGERKKKVNLLD